MRIDKNSLHSKNGKRPFSKDFQGKAETIGLEP